MKVLSINIGSPTHLPGMQQRTGIVKMPKAEPVHVNASGLDGDSICNTRHHGGPDQAVYLYGEPDYDWWSAQLGAALPPGTFGENLTLSDLASNTCNAGDRFFIGEVILEATAPRIPCSTLGRRMGNPNFPTLFRAAERPGVYCRVIKPGMIRPGDTVTAQPFSGPIVPLIELFRSYYRDEDEDADTLRWHLSAPIAIRAAEQKRSRLAKLNPAE
jgi:MOSC domain-containing protein YiiM